MTLQAHILNIPTGYTEVVYQGKRYGLSRQDFNGGRSLKVFAEELGGKDFISFNYYLPSSGAQLKPCEMPETKVVEFIMGMEPADGAKEGPVEKYGLPQLFKADFEAQADRYEFRQGFPDFPLCPWGGHFAGLGYDREAQRYVWLVKSILKDPRLQMVRWEGNTNQ